jgi:hypothetical protein
MHFLGSVNCFHGEVKHGKVVLGSVVFDPAHVTRIKSAGPVVKVEVLSDVGQACQVEIPYEHFQELPLTTGAPVFLNLRDARVFVGEAAP